MKAGFAACLPIGVLWASMFALATPAAAQVGPPALAHAPGSSPGSALYEDALQSIAEGRKNDASKALMRVIKEQPMHAGAYLEVALIQCGLGHADEAERLFAIIETRFNPSLDILELIANARETGCDRWQAITASSLAFGRGIDQNVNQGASSDIYLDQLLLPDFLPRHDQYTMFAAEHLREITPNGSIAFVQYQGRRNDSLSPYDSASLYLGIESPYRFGRWTLRTTAMLGLTSLGGNFYQRQLQLQARLGAPLSLPNNIQLNLMGGITHTNYRTLVNFDSNTYELRGQFTHRRDNLYASASLGVQDDRANAERPGGGRKGVAFNLLARRGLWDDTSGELGYMLQRWNSNLPYAPGLIEEVRKQSTHVLRATYVHPISKNQTLQLEARVVRNKENISLFQYNSRLLQLSWHLQGP